MSSSILDDVEGVLAQLTLEEKVSLLAGQGRCRTTGVERLGIPPLDTSDGPHGLRGYPFFKPNKGCLLPCGTAMGATFDIDLMNKVGNLLAGEALCRHIAVILGPVVCLQRSPQIGRGFEAFGEDPVASGILGAAYIRGIQERGIAACVKHFAAHDQSFSSTEDNCVMSQRTLREMHALSFQIAIKHSNPWAVMTSYNMINGVHASENTNLLQEILREEWAYDNLVLSDWWGTYSTREAMTAGMDLEMPGPTVWRGGALVHAVSSRKLPVSVIDTSVKRVLELVRKTQPALAEATYNITANDTAENRQLIRKVAAESVVLLKNEKGVLPLNEKDGKTYGLIGDHWKNAAFSGGGSSEVDPYYSVQPYDAFLEHVPKENISVEVGCYSHRWQPLIYNGLENPFTKEPGFQIDFYRENPEENPDTPVFHSDTTEKSYMLFADCLPKDFPADYFVKIKSTYTSPRTMRWRFGLSVGGKAKLSLNGKTIIDQWTDHPEKKKDDVSPCFNGCSMERFAEFDLIRDQKIELEFLLTNKGLGTPTGVAPAAGIRLGGSEVIDEDKSIAVAVELAKNVDVPIIITGLSSDYELENADRSSLSLPGRVDELIERVLEANANTIIVTQSGLPILMPWAHKATAVVHAWLGGQEAGHGIADVLFGKTNPSGRLTLTFPKRLQDTPTFLTFGKADYETYYGEGVFIGYRYYEKLQIEPEFYFGHGLSYTQFEYSNLVVPGEFAANTDHQMKISVDVQNTGSLAGAEVVQVYIADPESQLQRPDKEFKAFDKVYLEPGEKKTVKLSLDKYALSYWSQEHSKWLAEAGKFEVVVARSANPKHEVLRAGFDLPKTFQWSGL